MRYSPPEHIALHDEQEAAQQAYLAAWDELERFKAKHGVKHTPDVQVLPPELFPELERLNQRYAETWNDWQTKFRTWMRVTGGFHDGVPELL